MLTIFMQQYGNKNKYLLLSTKNFDEDLKKQNWKKVLQKIIYEYAVEFLTWPTFGRLSGQALLQYLSSVIHCTDIPMRSGNA